MSRSSSSPGSGTSWPRGFCFSPIFPLFLRRKIFKTGREHRSQWELSNDVLKVIGCRSCFRSVIFWSILKLKFWCFPLPKNVYKNFWLKLFTLSEPADFSASADISHYALRETFPVTCNFLNFLLRGAVLSNFLRGFTPGRVPRDWLG